MQSSSERDGRPCASGRSVSAKYGASLSRSLIHCKSYQLDLDGYKLNTTGLRAVSTYPTYFLVGIFFAAAVTSGSLIARNVSTASMEKTTYEPGIGIKSKITDSLPEFDII